MPLWRWPLGVLAKFNDCLRIHPGSHVSGILKIRSSVVDGFDRGQPCSEPGLHQYRRTTVARAGLDGRNGKTGLEIIDGEDAVIANGVTIGLRSNLNRLDAPRQLVD